MLLETQMKSKIPTGRARLNVLYVLSAICRKSKKQHGLKDKYCESLPSLSLSFACIEL